MRLPILCGILGAVCLLEAHDWWELRTAHEEERQAWSLADESQERLRDKKRYSWEPPFGTKGMRLITGFSSTAVVAVAARDSDNYLQTIHVDSEGRVIISPESIRSIIVGTIFVNLCVIVIFLGAIVVYDRMAKKERA